MLDKVLKIQDTVDVYIKDLEDNKVILTFHKMTTRERIELVTSKSVAEFLALLDGKIKVEDVLNYLGNFSKQNAEELVSYLLSEHLLTDTSLKRKVDIRFDRQINYFDDMVLDRSGEKTQELLSTKKVVFLGCGAVGAAIAEILVRAGIRSVTLVDYKLITSGNIDQHLFASNEDLGQLKTTALSEYLSCINKDLEIEIHNEKLIPSSDLEKWISDNVDLVVNSCDEPYIGHTSLKLGRFLQKRKIPLYIAGGFDAHLMSSGELIYPPYSPCIDCAQQTFTDSLGDWKPTYSYVETSESIVENKKDKIEKNYNVGGAGGLIMMSGFSANLSCVKIIQFLCQDSSYDYTPIRYEYLPNHGEMTKFKLSKQDKCNVCKR